MCFIGSNQKKASATEEAQSHHSSSLIVIVHVFGIFDFRGFPGPVREKQATQVVQEPLPGDPGALAERFFWAKSKIEQT